MKFDEGYIKFKLNWEQKAFDFNDPVFLSVNSYRKKLFDLQLIGIYPNGIGFGNISVRDKNNRFIISGSATGAINNPDKSHYALVTGFNISDNSVECEGLSKASSESLSHGTIYESNHKINAVIHIHHHKMWQKYLDKLPTSNKKAEFGTPEIATEIGKLAVNDSGIIIMGGHPEGIITFGKSLEEAYEILLKYYKNI